MIIIVIIYDTLLSHHRQGEISCLTVILLSLMYSTMVLMVVCWRYGMPFDANGCVSALMNVG